MAEAGEDLNELRREWGHRDHYRALPHGSAPILATAAVEVEAGEHEQKKTTTMHIAESRTRLEQRHIEW